LLVAALAAPPADARLVTRRVGAPPLPDRVAAAKVRRAHFEPRPDNRAATHRVPTARQLRSFRRRSTNPYRDSVDGDFTGTTDEVLQWGAYKWGFSPDLFRAVAATESWWRMNTVGDNGDSFGLMQMRRPYHCCLPEMAHDAAFNVDYYGSMLRAYFDGRETWLNSAAPAQPYRAGDLWGSVGVWYSGQWHVNDAVYVAQVQDYIARQVWFQPSF
jgi:hypothetical protein